MNSYYQGRVFLKALAKADLFDTDMSAEDWAQGCGLMTTYGHGYIFKDFTEDEAVKAIEKYAEAVAEEMAEAGRIEDDTVDD